MSYTMSDLLRFSPSVRLHPDDLYRPATVESFFQNASLLNGSGGLIKAAPVSVQDLLDNLDKNNYMALPVIGTVDDRPDDWKDNTDYRGAPLVDGRCEVPMYVRVTQGTTKPGLYDFWYFFFYPYNGPQNFYIEISNSSDTKTFFQFPDFATHQGDWEHVRVTVSSDFKAIESVFYAAHGDRDATTLPGSEVPTVDGTHPIAYSGWNSHASYPTIGTPTEGAGGRQVNTGGNLSPLTKAGTEILKLLGTIDFVIDVLEVVDFCDDGPLWEPFRSGSPDALIDVTDPSGSTGWAEFPGRWGIASWPNDPLELVGDVPKDAADLILGVAKAVTPFLPSSLTEGGGPTGPLFKSA